jgi:predicted  nucleic acid-binding Zn-ribbon protein
MATTEQEHEVDSLGHLEDRIQKAVALVNRLRQEKDAASKELEASRAAFEDSQNQNAKLSEELESLREERRQVRTRIERLLNHIDQLGAA